MRKKLLATLVVAVVLVLSSCQTPADGGVSQADFDSLKQRVDDIILFLNGDDPGHQRPDPTDPNFESLAEWHDRVKTAVCTLEVLEGMQDGDPNRLCPHGPTDPNGNPPPSPPFF